MDYSKEYEEKQRRVDEYIEKFGKKPTLNLTITPEIEFYANTQWLLGYNAGANDILDNVDSIITKNMNNKINVEEK